MTNFDTESRDIESRLTEETREYLRSHPNVLGTSVGIRQTGGRPQDEVAVIVHVNEKYSEEELTDEALIPETVECGGEPIVTDVKRAGDVSTDNSSGVRAEEIRPVVGGTEISADSTGTITGLLRTSDDEPRFMTARHVVGEADSDVIGNAVYQPGSGERIGEVIDASALYADGTRRSQLDIAIIEPDDDVETSGKILGWGEADDVGYPNIDDRVIVFGKARGVAGGTVVSRGVSASIDHNGSTVEMTGLIEYDYGGREGTSGAPVGMIDHRTGRLTLLGIHIASGTNSFLTPWRNIEWRFGELTPDSDVGVTRTDTEDTGPTEPEQARLTVYVEDEDGDSLSSVTIRVDGEMVTTGSGGSADFDLDAGEYEIDVSRDGYHPATETVELDEGSRRSITIVMERDYVMADLTVVVEDTDGDPVTNATVTVDDDSEDVDSDGEAEFELEAGSYTVEAEAPSFDDNSIDIELDWGESATEVIELTPTDDPYTVDDFERDNHEPWQNSGGGDAYISSDSALGPDSTRGFYIPEQATVSTNDLDNMLAADGGPNGEGAFEFYYRFESFGGTSDQGRFFFGDTNHFRLADDRLGLRLEGQEVLTFFFPVGVGDTRLVRVYEWTSNSLDVGIYDEDGEEELDRQSVTDSRVSTSGEMELWVNFTTEFSIDDIRYID